ncbi:uncharacterized protein ACLA_091500 [Aspergillus clavatus NRRL 1]|uniref:Thioesterase domain-containing protein n=1 Tax=Aspergillus clavatus (strain ATCC 1007 / CBS 513.65 / DSM 816 / NCTC 3887 / NRRL 1 / QM 1276 / 107) TaxID=344612 RepID=A1CF03_ASPCL|nr:uncharacterized protein ACLA_091500 [Aspergillus clavatus NRRL 1]EAW11452.1 hypothetical protein ACLA_091500 [Aspergillus clavatus NRRL 1]
MFHPVERPATPAVLSTPLQKSLPNILSKNSDSESDPVSSTSDCPCCRLPSVPELSTLAEAIPQLDLNKSVTLEEQFLKSLAIEPAVGSTVRAAAVVPQDQRAAGHYLLIDLLCHRLFSTFGHQEGIRNYSVYYYEHFIPGDTLTVVARKVFQRQLSWLEATVARDSILVATATAQYDNGLEPEEGIQIFAEKLFTDRCLVTPLIRSKIPSQSQSN